MPSQPPITIVLAHFDDLLARGLDQLIQGDRSLEIVATDVQHRRIPVVLRAHRPDVAILDVGSLTSPSEVRKLSEGHPGTRLVLLANEPSTAECVQLLAFGASACLARDTQSRDLLHAIHLASRGLQVSPRVARHHAGPSIAGGLLLTRREAEVLPLLQQGRSNAQIAVTLQVGVETVRTHARNIYRKLGVSSRRELNAPSTADLAPAPTGRPARRRAGSVRGHPRRGHGLRRD